MQRFLIIFGIIVVIVGVITTQSEKHNQPKLSEKEFSDIIYKECVNIFYEYYNTTGVTKVCDCTANRITEQIDLKNMPTGDEILAKMVIEMGYCVKK